MAEALKTIVVVGGGQAGGQVVATLRSRGFDGKLHLIAAEPHLPYERPPLSKGVLTSERAVESCLMKKAAFYEEKEVELHLGTSVTDVDARERKVRAGLSATVGYDALFLCTGSRLVTLDVPGCHLDGIYYLRSWDDAEALRPKLVSGARVAVVGGGYIGLEVAAAARKQDAEVTVLEAAEEVMARVVAAPVGEAIRRYHADKGVAILLRSRVAGFEGEHQVQAVLTEDGRRVEADIVVIGIGVGADDALAKSMELAVDDGIVVDAFGRTSNPHVFGAGDATRQPNPFTDGPVRLESWQNAQFQAMAAAKAALGDTSRPHAMVPWFWSDQGDLNLQMLGAPRRWDATVRRGGDAAFPASVFYLREEVVVAHNALNAHDDVRPAKRLIESRKPVVRERLGDPSVPLTDVLA